MRDMRNLWRRPGGRLALGVAVVALAAVVVGLGALGVYVFGGNGPSSHAPVSAATLVPTKDETAFTIVPSASEATFTIDEVLFGRQNTVVGKTSSVAGEILVNAQHPSQSRVGQIRVDVSTLLTDSQQRNHTLQSRILETDNAANQYATFTTTAIKGMPASVTAGQTLHFQLVGELTVHQVTKSETFDATLTAKSASELTGTARTTVRYKDFNLSIPDVPFVSNVSDSVTLALTFTATTATHS